MSIPFAINRMAAPLMPLEAFFRMVVDLGVDAVEIRNDLKGVEIQDGTAPEKVRGLAQSHGLELLTINALYPFDVWDPTRADQAESLARYARDAGAGGLVLCPLNDHQDARDANGRRADLVKALRGLAPILREHGIMGYVEPLGFPQSALRHKQLAVEAIAEVQGEDQFKLVHDTFHHHLASDSDFFPEQTGLVHISGVEARDVSVSGMLDGHRLLVGKGDLLGNVEQIRTLLERGYSGYFSFEPFSEEVHRLENIQGALRASMEYLNTEVNS